MMSSQTLSLTPSDQSSLHFLRCLAIIKVMVCHGLETYTLHYASWFYTGAILFLVISGFLYGRKPVPDPKTYAIGRLQRVGIPYWTFLVFLLPFYLYCSDLSPLNVCSSFALTACGLRKGFEQLPGMNHLWFIAAIVACYISIPLLQRFRGRGLKTVLAGYLLFAIDIFVLDGRYYWFPLYVTAYFMGNLPRTSLRQAFAITSVLTLLTLVNLSYLPIHLRYHLLRSLFPLLLTLLTIRLFEDFHLTRLPNFLAYLSLISFPLYLVHNPLMMGPCSLAFLTDSHTLNMISVIALSLLSAVALHLLSQRITQWFVRK